MSQRLWLNTASVGLCVFTVAGDSFIFRDKPGGLGFWTTKVKLASNSIDSNLLKFLAILIFLLKMKFIFLTFCRICSTSQSMTSWSSGSTTTFTACTSSRRCTSCRSERRGEVLTCCCTRLCNDLTFF